MRNREEIKNKVSEIAGRMECGQTTTQIMKEYTAKWGVTHRTIERYVALAKDIVGRGLKKREAAIEAARADIIMEEAEKWLKSNLELEARLCAIISGKITFERPIQTKDGVVMVKCHPSCREVISAMNLLLKMRGAFITPQMAENSNEPSITIIVDNERDKQIIEKIKNLELK